MRTSYAHGGLAALAIATMLVACGGGGGGGGGNGPPPNRLPTSNAGVDQSAFKTAVVTLDGSASADPDGNPLTYRWTQTSGPAVSLSGGTTARPTFTAPAISGTVGFSLVVNDGHGDSTADAIQVSVANRVPVASAGADASVDSSTLFTLNALGSSDPDSDTLTYSWVQLAGPPVFLTTVAPGRARFIAPSISTQLEFGVVANDGEAASAQDVVLVEVTRRSLNEPPVVYLDPAYTTPKRALVNIWGYAYDPEGGPITFNWTQVDGPSVTIDDPSQQYLSFNAPTQLGDLTFELVVSDGASSSQPMRIVVTVQNFAPTINDAAITPDGPRTADNLELASTVDDADVDPLTLTYAWRRNGVLVPSITGSTYPASLTTRDDEIVGTLAVSDGTDTTSIDVSTVIQDSPPVLTASPPASVNYGDTFAFTVSVGADPDGDPVGAFDVKLGPAGFTVNGSGAVSWVAKLPMFDDHVDVAWDIGLHDSPSASLNGTVRVNHAARQLPFMRSGITVQQNHEEVAIADLDANGTSELLTTDGRVLSVMSKSGTDFVQTWSYPFNLSGNQNGISAIAAADVTGDANQEIFATSEGKIRQLRGGARTLAHEYSESTLTLCYGLRIADLDGDGQKELLCLGTDTGTYSPNGGSVIVVLDAADLTFKWRINQTGLGTNFNVGNVDGDAALEIVTAGGFVYDGITHNNEWAYGPQFGSFVELGDVNGDGSVEIVAAGNGSAIRFFSAVSRSPLAELNPAGVGGYINMYDFRVANVDGDAAAEILFGGGPGGGQGYGLNVWKHSGAPFNFVLAGNLPAQDYDVSGLISGNLDADPAIEIVWATGIAHSGEDKLVVSEYTGLDNVTLEWISTDPGELDGPFVGGFLARTAPATTRLIYMSPSTHSGYDGTRLLALDASSGDVTTTAEIGTNWANASGLDIGDTDGDSLDEVFLSSANLYDPFYTTYDFASDTREWTSPAGFAQAIAIRHADFTGDGRPEFVVLGSDSRVTVFNVAQSNIVFQSVQLTGAAAGIDVADLDHDGQPEIVVLTAQFLYVYGRASSSAPFLERANIPLTNGLKLLVADADGDGEFEIFTTVNTSPYYYDPQTVDLRVFSASLQQLRSVPLSVNVSNLVLEPSASSRKNLLVSTELSSYSYYSPGATEIWAIDPLTGAGVWRSPQLAGSFSRDSLHPVDVNNDGQYELAFGTIVGAYVTR